MFRVGDKVVHPVHGAGTVSRIEERTESGNTVVYYIIPDVLASCELMVPVSNADEIGLRPAMPQARAQDVYDAIRDGGANGDDPDAKDGEESEEIPEPLKSARTLGRLLGKLKGGSISQAERRQVDRLRRLLVGELSLVTGYAETRISTLIDSNVIAVSVDKVDAARAKSRK